jgi:hypothetical protein
MDRRIRDLARNDIVVKDYLKQYDMGYLPEKEALVRLICNLAEHKRQLCEQCVALVSDRTVSIVVKSLDQIVVDDETK